MTHSALNPLYVLLISIMLFGCASKHVQPDLETRQQLEMKSAEIAADFVCSLSKNENEHAYNLLSDELRSTLSIQELIESWTNIIEDKGEFESMLSLSAHFSQEKGVNKGQVALKHKFQEGNVFFFLEVSADGYITTFFHQAEPTT